MIKKIDGGVCAPKGFKAAGMHCGVRKNHSKKDIAMIFCEVPGTAAAVYTQNKVYGAPITVTRKNLSNGVAQAVICNSGNANTANLDGVEKAQLMSDLTAKALGIKSEDIIVASTGVIGQSLDMEPISYGISELPKLLSVNGGNDAAQAIMTTDTKVKEISLETEIGGKPVRFGAISKGSGMIHPNMATMLSFITTDVNISPEMLHKALVTVVNDTYNMISVDGDTSTNDMVSVIASGLSGNEKITSEGGDYDKVVEVLYEIGGFMAKMIAGDGEGATKLLTCKLYGAADIRSAKVIAKSVIASSLVKAAMFGADANCGRVLCAMGYSGEDFDPSGVTVWFESEAGSIKVCEQGCGLKFDEDIAKKVLLEKEIVIKIKMAEGDAEATAWGCDLTYDYVKINGDYRT